MPKLEDEQQVVDEKSTSKMIPQHETDFEPFRSYWKFLHWRHARNTLQNDATLREYFGMVHPAFDVFLNWAVAKEDEKRIRKFLEEHVFILPKEEDRLRLIGCLSEGRGRKIMRVYKNMLLEKYDHNNKHSLSEQETPSKTASTNTPN